ncbi:MAG TPA: hypothetical protein VE981_21615 [Planctomycetota bacterium]|nr:hypothetical protein [Planctomycetota bacterium]
MTGLLALLLVAAQDPAPKELPPDPFVVKVTDAVRARRDALVSQATGSKVKFEDAVERASKFDAAIVDDAAEKLGVTADQIREAWAKRERKPRSIAYGDGSWIPLGGQNGGLDSDVKGTPVPETTDLVGGGPSILTRRKKPPPGEPVPLGKPLKTKEEWWATATSGERVAFVEGEFVRKSSLVEKKEEPKKCPKCSAKGTIAIARGGIGLAAVCPRCHGAKEDLVVVYE